MQRSAWLIIVVFALGALETPAAEPDPARVLDEGKLPDDYRLGKPRNLHGYFPMTPPATCAAWEVRRQELRAQVLVALGLWPMPEKIPLQPTIHGKIDRDDYTIEKVYFASYPGHYVTGNVYRPKSKGGLRAGVLCPHGHWPNGRFHDAGAKKAEAEIKHGAEKTMEGARYPLQARCVQLARMGCVVFHYDMVGYADSQQIPHRQGFDDAEAQLRLQSAMGLQTFNSIRALDFLVSLPDVDPERIGVTGASGGGTQTFILCAIDDRPAAAFPAVMVSTAMQGGCVCENCSFLRLGTGNIELAALFAPKPIGMSGANDWTKEIETKGLPQLKALYKLHDAEDCVMAKCFPEFEHNYNQVSREVMYNWFNIYLQLGLESVAEKPFVPVPPKDLSVFDEDHPRPKDAVDAERLRKYMTEATARQIKALPSDIESHWLNMKADHFSRMQPKTVAKLLEDMATHGDAKTPVKLLARMQIFQKVRVFGELVKTKPQLAMQLHEEFRRHVDSGDPVVGTALRILIHDWLPQADEIEEKSIGPLVEQDSITIHKLLLARKPMEKNDKEQVPALELRGPDFDGTIVVWIHPEGKASLFREGKLMSAARQILDKKAAILAPDVFLTGEFGANRPAVDKKYAGFTFGYNRPLLANRVHDILTAVRYAKGREGTKSVALIGHEKAGPWVILAAALCGDAVQRTAADMDCFRFEKVQTIDDDMMLPGALKYGGMPAFAALCAPGELYLHNLEGTGIEESVKGAYGAAGKRDNLQLPTEKVSVAKIVEWLLR